MPTTIFNTSPGVTGITFEVRYAVLSPAPPPPPPINNGLTLTESGLNGYAQTLSSFGSDVLEFYGKMYLNGGTTATYCYAGVGYVPADGAGIYTGIMSAGCPSSSQVFVTNTGSSPITTVTSQSVWGIAYGGSSAATSYLYNNYLQLASRSDTSTNYPAPFGFFIQANSGWAFFAQWARVRAYPPNGKMPSATFGVIQGGSPSVTVSPSSVSVPSGTSFTLTADVGGGTSPYTYQWYNATSGTGIPIANAISSTYTATAGSAAGTFDYYVKIKDSESPPQTAQSSNSVVTVSLPPSSVTYYVPITLTNSQSTATPAPFQQMVNISESAYSSYLTYNGNFANFEFFTSSGTVIPAWIESSNSGKLITWVKLPKGIPAESNTIIYLGFASTSSNLLSSSGTTGIGEAPQLSCGSTPTSSCSTYAEYDDGAKVFNFYDNFAGTTLSSKWTVGGGQTYTINNGLTLNPSSTTYVIGINSINLFNSQQTIAEIYGSFNAPVQSSPDNGQGFFIGSSSGNPVILGGYEYFGANLYGLYTFIRSFYAEFSPMPTASTNYIYSWWETSSGTYAEYNYANPASTSNIETSGSYPLVLFNMQNMGGNMYVQYVRTRAYPPNDVMPSVAFGSVV